MRTIIMVAGLATLTLAGCNQAGDKAKDAPGAAVDAAAPAAATGLPEGPTPGLWRVTTSIAGMPASVTPPAMETCITESKFESQGPAPETPGMTCEHPTFRRDGDAVLGRSVCTSTEGVRMESDYRLTGDFTRRYTMEVKTTTTPAPTPAMASTTMTMNLERLGDCPASAAQ
ncbi:DUF3617 domain-containing protein [Brevundimonas lenta]|uniref:DUF3617 family protein n=1 Tax=Brevundimonas lenta TaxID=424796 RepID=A0A7W6JE73_9CAUL|nr:DUF3617 family protein [Brevundimonas lenta]MBB4082497.1 hypothetical protein [Brevundimonas lenta]